MIGLEKFICFWLLRIFGLTATYTVAPRQCKLNKFICIALGFCVYLQPELKERCRSGRTGQSRKLLNSLWVPGVRIPLSPQACSSGFFVSFCNARRRRQGMCDRREQIPRERDGSWPLCPAAGGRGCATIGSKSPVRETVRGRFAPPQAAGDVRPQYLTCDHEAPYEDAIC